MRIVKSFVGGACPHAHTAPKSYLQRTIVIAAHIASAVGT